MTLLRNIWADLVDKRLWPVALALVVALVAVPVLLAKPRSGGGPAPVASATPGAAVADPASLGSRPDGGPVGGRFKDPFRQQHVPPDTTSLSGIDSALGPGTASAGTAGSGSPGGSTSSGDPASSGGGGGSRSAPVQNQAADQKVTRLRVKFGPAEGKQATRDLTPGAPLPSATNPLLVFTNLGKDGKTASFLVSSDAQREKGSDGRCRPDTTICAELSLKPGQTAFFDVTSESGRQARYQLDVVKVIRP